MDWFHILLLGSTVFLGALAALAAFVATDKARALEKLCGTLRNERDAARRELLALSQEMERQVRVLEGLAERAADAAGSYRGS